MTTQNIDLVAGTRITLGGVGSDYALDMLNKGTGYQQSAKINFGANWADQYNVWLTTTLQSAPTAGATMDLWIGYSASGTAGTDNWGGCSGAYGVYTGNNSDAATSVLQLDRIGSLVLSAATSTQKGVVGSFTPRAQYGYVVWYNGSGQTTHASTAGTLTFEAVTSRIEAAV